MESDVVHDLQARDVARVTPIPEDQSFPTLVPIR